MDPTPLQKSLIRQFLDAKGMDMIRSQMMKVLWSDLTSESAERREQAAATWRALDRVHQIYRGIANSAETQK